MSIPLGSDYTSSMSGAALKLVRCEQCGTEYGYCMERSATGTGTSLLFLDNAGAAERASARAEAALQRKLERGVDLVPCPSCGWYQKNMIPKARRVHRRWMLLSGGYLMLGLLPLAMFGSALNAGSNGVPRIPWNVFLVGLAALAFLGVGLMITKFVAACFYNPNNQDIEIRKQIGRSRALHASSGRRWSELPETHGVAGRIVGRE